MHNAQAGHDLGLMQAELPMQAITSQCRAYLAAVIIWLAGQKGKEAYLCYQVSFAYDMWKLMSLIAKSHKCQLEISCHCHLQDALTVQNFTTSEEAFAAEDLCNAFRSGDAEKITALIKPNSLYLNVDNQVSSLRVLIACPLCFSAGTCQRYSDPNDTVFRCQGWLRSCQSGT
jgi:hypothetical protein